MGMGMSIRIWLLALVITLQFAAVAQASLAVGGLQQTLNEYAGKIGPGVIVGIDRGGRQWFGLAGVADLETGRAMSVQDQVRLASISKTFTAILTMKLAEEGRLSLSDTVEKWLPGKIANGNAITVGMLLNHSGGLNDKYMETPFLESLRNQGAKAWTTAEMVQAIASANTDPKPGTTASYSNAGYYLLGVIAEAASGERVNDALTKRFFRPAGMSRTALLRDGTLTAPFAHGYTDIELDGTAIKNLNTTNMNLSWDWTAGSAVSTAADMVNGIRALVSGQVVPDETFRQMVTPAGPDTRNGYGAFGYGIMVSAKDGVPVLYFHEGQSTGMNTGWYYDIATDTVIFINVNHLSYLSDEEAMQQIAMLRALMKQVLLHTR